MTQKNRRHAPFRVLGCQIPGQRDRPCPVATGGAIYLTFQMNLYSHYFSTKIDEKTLFYCAISTRSVIMYFTEGSVRNLPQKDTRRCPGIGCSGEREVRRGQNTL